MQYKTSMREFEPYGSVYEQSVHQKMHNMSSFRDRQISGVVGAIRELLTLTQDEYDE